MTIVFCASFVLTDARLDGLAVFFFSVVDIKNYVYFVYWIERTNHKNLDSVKNLLDVAWLCKWDG